MADLPNLNTQTRHARILSLLLARTAFFPICAPPYPALDEQVPNTQELEGIQDIFVTTRRISERDQTTRVAVTALSSDSLKEMQITDAFSLRRVAPGVSIAAGAASSSGFVFVSIRGQGDLNPGAANDPAVGTYIDGIYIPRPSQG